MTMTREHVEALVARLVGKTWYVTDSTGQRWADDAPEDAARALLAALDDLDAVKKDAAAMEAQILRDRPLRENTIDDANMWKCFGVEAQSGMVQKIWEQRKSANARAEAAEAANAAMTAREGVLRMERDRFESALSRAVLVGGTTYLVERAEKAEAEAEAAETALAAMTARNEAMVEALGRVEIALDGMHASRMISLGRDPAKYNSELSMIRDKARTAIRANAGEG